MGKVQIQGLEARWLLVLHMPVVPASEKLVTRCRIDMLANCVES